MLAEWAGLSLCQQMNHTALSKLLFDLLKSFNPALIYGLPVLRFQVRLSSTSSSPPSPPSSPLSLPFLCLPALPGAAHASSDRDGK